MIGEKLSPVLIEIENAIIDSEIDNRGKPNYTNEGFRAAIKIFISVLMDKMYDLQLKEDMDIEVKKSMAENSGIQLRLFIKTYTGIDTHDLYKL